ncbi:MAG TPA: potassium channel family protein, partial [Thermoanaerobaculia bacterium]|nr:potassium channel family protein [Thermoanaerobaculia bacterium]
MTGVQKSPPRRNRVWRVARRRGAAVLRLQQIDVAAAGDIERVSARTDDTFRFAGQRRMTRADGAQQLRHLQPTTYNEVMRRSTRRLLALAVGLIAFILGSALLYQMGMARLEGHPRTFWDSFEWAAETLSTTGYGADSHWNHPAMVLLVVAVQFVGVFLFFLVVPIFMIPFLEERFEEKLPRTAGKITDHVIVYRYGSSVETLMRMLDRSGVAAIVVETDEALARSVVEQQQRVVFSRAEEDALDACNLAGARALVANARDEENAAIILRARQMGFNGDIIALVEEPAHRRPIELAGATAAYTPRHIIAAALAAHASDRNSPRLAGAEALDGLVRREVRVSPANAAAGKTLAETGIGERTG